MPIYEVVGDVMGDVMGDGVDGYDEVGAGPAPGQQALQHMRQHFRHGHGQPNHQRVMIAKRPGWRDGQAAPGVMLPDEGMVPLGLKPDGSGGTFSATSGNLITWIGKLQKPYRAERLLVSVARTGTTATGRLLGQFFVGVDLNQATIDPLDIEVFGAPNAFGTRLTLLQAPPGVEITVPVVISVIPTTPDTVFAAVAFAGRIIH